MIPLASPADAEDRASTTPHEAADLSLVGQDQEAAVEPTVRQEEDEALCCICQDVISSAPVETLWCGHVFHVYCVVEWRQLCRKTVMDCPYRCSPVQPGQPIQILVACSQIAFLFSYFFYW